MVLIAPKLSDSTINSQLLKYFAKCQLDEMVGGVSYTCSSHPLGSCTPIHPCPLSLPPAGDQDQHQHMSWEDRHLPQPLSEHTAHDTSQHDLCSIFHVFSSSPRHARRCWFLPSCDHSRIPSPRLGVLESAPWPPRMPTTPPMTSPHGCCQHCAP